MNNAQAKKIHKLAMRFDELYGELDLICSEEEEIVINTNSPLRYHDRFQRTLDAFQQLEEARDMIGDAIRLMAQIE